MSEHVKIISVPLTYMYQKTTCFRSSSWRNSWGAVYVCISVVPRFVIALTQIPSGMYMYIYIISSYCVNNVHVAKVFFFYVRWQSWKIDTDQFVVNEGNSWKFINKTNVIILNWKLHTNDSLKHSFESNTRYRTFNSIQVCALSSCLFLNV